MRWSREEILVRELDKALLEFDDYKIAIRVALERADEIFWDMVDQARQRAKDERHG